MLKIMARTKSYQYPPLVVYKPPPISCFKQTAEPTLPGCVIFLC